MRILIAEDETIIRLDLRELLEKAGFDVCAEAKDGEEAVALARTVEPDLALLDVKMPKLDGIEAARRILEERPIPIVMVTAYGEEELVSRAVEAGVFGYLVKPFRESDLLPAIATARARHDELAGAPRGGRLARRGARRAQGDRAREGAADGARGADRAGRVRAAAEGEPDLRAAAQGRRRRADRDTRRERDAARCLPCVDGRTAAVSALRRRRRCGRVAEHEAGGELDPERLDALLLDQPRQQADGHAAHLLERLAHGRQRRRDDARDVRVVEADDGEILRARAGRARGAAWIAPTAMLSFEAKIAVGGSARPSSVWARRAAALDLEVPVAR